MISSIDNHTKMDREFFFFLCIYTYFLFIYIFFNDFLLLWNFFVYKNFFIYFKIWTFFFFKFKLTHTYYIQLSAAEYFIRMAKEVFSRTYGVHHYEKKYLAARKGPPKSWRRLFFWSEFPLIFINVCLIT